MNYVIVGLTGKFDVSLAIRKIHQSFTLLNFWTIIVVTRVYIPAYLLIGYDKLQYKEMVGRESYGAVHKGLWDGKVVGLK